MLCLTGGMAKNPPKFAFDSSIKKRLLSAIELGLTYEYAAKIAGVAVSTLYNWKSWAAEGKQPYADLWIEVNAAEAIGMEKSLQSIRSAGNRGAWQAHAWILERRHPELFGKNRLELTGKDGGAIKLDLGSCTDEQLRLLAGESK